MKTQTCAVELFAGVEENYLQYSITGYVNDGKVKLFIDDYKKEQIGTIDGVLGETGNFSVVIRLHNSKYEKITVGAEVENEFIKHGGVSINEEIKTCYLEGLISEVVFARLTLFSEEGLSGFVVKGEMKYKK